jgi:hypothetical protein
VRAIAQARMHMVEVCGLCMSVSRDGWYDYMTADGGGVCAQHSTFACDGVHRVGMNGIFRIRFDQERY